MDPTQLLEQDRRRIASRPAYSILFLVFLLHATMGSYLQQTNLPFGIAYGELIFFAGIPLLATLAMGYSPWRFMGFSVPVGRAWPWIAAASVAGFVLAGGFNTLNQHLVGEELAERFDSTRILMGRSSMEQLALAFGVSVLAPIGEEILFRGYLMRILLARYGRTGALLATSALFAIAHVNPASVLALFALGMVFGALRIVSGSILPSLAAHAIQNGTTVVVVLFGAAESVEEPLKILPALALIAVALPALLFSLSMLRRVGGGVTWSPTLEGSSRRREQETIISRMSPYLLIWVVLALGSLGLLFLFGP